MIDFFTFSLIAFAFFPIVTKSLKDQPHAVERLTRGYLAILAICDVRPSALISFGLTHTDDLQIQQHVPTQLVFVRLACRES